MKGSMWSKGSFHFVSFSFSYFCLEVKLKFSYPIKNIMKGKIQNFCMNFMSFKYRRHHYYINFADMNTFSIVIWLFLAPLSALPSVHKSSHNSFTTFHSNPFKSPFQLSFNCFLIILCSNWTSDPKKYQTRIHLELDKRPWASNVT